MSNLGAPPITGKVYGDCGCAECKALRAAPGAGNYVGPAKAAPAGFVYEVRHDCVTAIPDAKAVKEHKDQVRRDASAPPKVNLPDATLTDGGRTTLRLLFWRGPQQEDTLPASGGAELIECGWAFKVNGWHALTENGIGAALQRGYGREKERKPNGC